MEILSNICRLTVHIHREFKLFGDSSQVVTILLCFRTYSWRASNYYIDVKWVACRLGFPVNRVFVQQFIQADDKET